MTKDDLLKELSIAIQQGVISKAEVLGLFEAKRESKFHALDLLYYIGGGIVVAGISVLLGQRWEEIGGLGRIVSTLGTFIIVYASAAALTKYEQYRSFVTAFFVLALCLLPVGLIVTVKEFSTGDASQGTVFLIAFLSFLASGISYLVFRYKVFMLGNLAYGAWAYFAAVNWLLYLISARATWKLSMYVYLLFGIWFTSLGLIFWQEGKRGFQAFVSFFGVPAILFTTLALSDWKPDNNWLWYMLAPLLSFFAILISAKLKSKIYLVFGSIGILAFISKMTAEYFSDSLGWPLAIIVAGFLLILTGYVSFNLRKKVETKNI